MSVIIRLQLLPLSAAAADIRAFFNGLRIPEGSVHIVGGPEGDAFIGFASDEDARQAMRRDHGQIHGSEVKLFLSSKTEMNEVISQARAGLRVVKSSPAQAEAKVAEPTPSWNSNENVAPAPVSQPVYPQQTPAPSAFVPDTSDYNKPAYMRMPAVGQQTQNIEQPYNGIRPPNSGYQAHFSSQSEPEPQRPYGAGPAVVAARNGPPPPFFNKNMSAEKPLLPPPHFKQQPPPGASDAKLADILSKLPAHLRPPHGVPPPHLRHLFPNMGALSMPPKSGSMPELAAPTVNPVPERPSLRNGAFQTDPHAAVPLRNESWRDTAPSAAPPVRNESAWSNNSNVPPSGRRPLINDPAPSHLRSNGLQPTKAFHYFELTRLPNEMLRPSILEEFVRPSVPLTLSSVKVVYDASGILLHTLLRLESEVDAANLMRKDGQQGIKIRTSSSAVFDHAVDGPVAPPANNGLFDQGRRNDRDRERREARERSPPRRRRSRSPIRRQRSRSRSRERRDYRDSRNSRERDSQHRSPPERRSRTATNRWCLQMNNVPFRMSEEHLNDWLAKRAKPVKVSRTYYADGNASDRWIAEFSDEASLDKAFTNRELLCGRTIKMKYIDNDVADEYLAIEDIYGKTRQQDNELNQMATLQMQHLNGVAPHPTNFYPAPPAIRGRGAPPFMFPPGRGRGGPPPHHMPPPFMQPPQPLFVPRGGFRGRGFGGPGGPRGGPPPHRPPFYRGGRGYHQSMPYHPQPSPCSSASTESLVICEKEVEKHEEVEQIKQEEEDEQEQFIELPEYPDDLLSIIGPHGCVIVCNGFPPDITLQEVISFFDGFDVTESSVRIKMGDDGVATGECMLAASSPEIAVKAVEALNGKKLREHKVSMKAPQ